MIKEELVMLRSDNLLLLTGSIRLFSTLVLLTFLEKWDSLVRNMETAITKKMDRCIMSGIIITTLALEIGTLKICIADNC